MVTCKGNKRFGEWSVKESAWRQKNPQKESSSLSVDTIGWDKAGALERRIKIIQSILIGGYYC